MRNLVPLLERAVNPAKCPKRSIRLVVWMQGLLQPDGWLHCTSEVYFDRLRTWRHKCSPPLSADVVAKVADGLAKP
jgi:hypothetical protein